MSLSREKFESIMQTTVKSFYHCMLKLGEKTTNRCTVPSWKLTAKQIAKA